MPDRLSAGQRDTWRQKPRFHAEETDTTPLPFQPKILLQEPILVLEERPPPLSCHLDLKAAWFRSAVHGIHGNDSREDGSRQQRLLPGEHDVRFGISTVHRRSVFKRVDVVTRLMIRCHEMHKSGPDMPLQAPPAGSDSWSMGDRIPFRGAAARWDLFL